MVPKAEDLLTYLKHRDVIPRSAPAGEESGSGEDVASARGNDGDTLPGILVHCVAGRSRSVTQTAAALMVVLRDWYGGLASLNILLVRGLFCCTRSRTLEQKKFVAWRIHHS